MFDDSTKPYILLEDRYIVPAEYKDKEIITKINRNMINSLSDEGSSYTSFEDLIGKSNKASEIGYEKFVSETYQAGDDLSGDTWFMQYVKNSTEVIFNKGNLLSYRFLNDFFVGGAHGGYNVNYLVYSLETGDRLYEKDIFIDGYQDELAKIIVDKIAADNNTREIESLGYYNAKEIRPNNNFYVDETGITYSYNQYEIAPYSVGLTVVSLPFGTIRHLLRENSPVSPLAK
jgi:hypothetical protein